MATTGGGSSGDGDFECFRGYSVVPVAVVSMVLVLVGQQVMVAMNEEVVEGRKRVYGGDDVGLRRIMVTTGGGSSGDGDFCVFLGILCGSGGGCIDGAGAGGSSPPPPPPLPFPPSYFTPLPCALTIAVPSPHQVLHNVPKGERLAWPEPLGCEPKLHCRKQLQQLVESCFVGNPRKRPTMDEVLTHLMDIRQEEKRRVRDAFRRQQQQRRRQQPQQ